MKYLVVIEKGQDVWGGYVPDLRGCAVMDETRDEAIRLIREAVEMYIASLHQERKHVPKPTSTTEYVQV